jgi:hypothetical protein
VLNDWWLRVVVNLGGEPCVAEFCGDLNPFNVWLKSKEGHDARARSVCPEIASRQQGGGGQLRLADRARARFRWKTDMSALPFINLLVVTLRAAWFNFRGWKKRP